ncbi:cadherin-related tumor suppressor-like [Schistocerca serialis cubense]|uniref:cadherin-related tumor suppressor-like n=1 Tax=Schistocerca serialis cubense TaxID=2023355 RepID=UPI00214EC334|nr:cadherin-related tumor suppressor-like [Schistocerca serialis cubense]
MAGLNYFGLNVRVEVLDRNDSPPSLSPSSPRELSVSEELPAGPAPLAVLAASDPDLEGELRFSLLPPPGAPAAADRFALDARSGALTLRAPLDREAADEYVLVVRLSDGVQHSDTAITVRVTDTNDNPPVFPEAAYSFDMPENAARGARVGEVCARDLDQGVNGHISYSVVSDWANDVFSLHPQTGVFTLTARLDYEEVAHYIFVVQAQDSGRPPLSSTVSVYFNVLDLNDNAPLFDPMSYSNEVFENITVGSPVLTVSATDLDSGENGHIEYSISAGDAAGDFAITANGSLVTARALDREARPLYNLLVTARDRGRPPLSSTVQVTVVLKDVNDAAPEFISPGEVSVAENTPAGTVVLAVKAVDRDEGRNGYVEYSLVAGPGGGGDAARLFSVGATDGLVRVTGRLDRETRALYELWVEARDRGQPPPVFDPRQYSASVAENASIGASVLQEELRIRRSPSKRDGGGGRRKHQGASRAVGEPLARAEWVARLGFQLQLQAARLAVRLAQRQGPPAAAGLRESSSSVQTGSTAHEFHHHLYSLVHFIKTSH